MSKRNDPIGTVECPTKGCSEECNVYRFRERGESEKSVANRRFAGKLYARCPKHGTFGGSAGDQEMQEYILCHAKMHGAGDRQPAPAKAPATPPAKQTSTPASSPAPQASRSARPSAKSSVTRSRERLPAASSSQAKPSVSTTPATASEAPAKKRSGFGFFGWDE